jgi:hypothetical protein
VTKNWKRICSSRPETNEGEVTTGEALEEEGVKKRAGGATKAFRAAANGLQRSDH